MDNLKIWILSLCGSTAIVSLLKILLSKSKLKKTINVFLSVFVLLYTILPFKLSIDDKNKYDITIDETNYEISYKDGYDRIIVESVSALCEEYSIDVISIQVDSYIEDSYIIVNELEVTIENKNKIQEATELIKRQLGYEVVVN